MKPEPDEMTIEEKTNRIETLLHELHSQEHRTFLEIQFDSLGAVYQSYPDNHNIIYLTTIQREALQDIIDDYDLQIIFEDTYDEYITVTAAHSTEPTAKDHMTILKEILSDVYDISFKNATLAFLSSRGPDTPEPLLWTDLENK